MKKILMLVFATCLCLSVTAQVVAPLTWTAYGLTFNAPKGILVEEDTEDTFLLNSSRFYITIHSLDSDGINKDGLSEVLLGLADEDGVKEQTEPVVFDLEQFYGIWLKGVTESDPCYYACLMTKDAGNIFYISIIYNRTADKEVEKMLKSFKMDEE